MPSLFTNRRSHHYLLTVMAAGFVAISCTTATQRLHPQFPKYRQAMGVILVVSPQIDIFEKMPDGSRIYREALSRDAREAAQQAIVSQLHRHHFEVRTVDPDTLSTSELIGITSLFKSVNRSIQLHTIGPQVFPNKKKVFDYHLGTVAEMLKAYRADGLVLTLGHQTGIDRPDRNWLSIAVVEPQGRIIWYGIDGDHERFAIQSTAGMQALVASTMANFWESGS